MLQRIGDMKVMKIDIDGRVYAAVDMEPPRHIGQVIRNGHEWVATLAIADANGRTGRSYRDRNRMSAAAWIFCQYRMAYRPRRVT